MRWESRSTTASTPFLRYPVRRTLGFELPPAWAADGRPSHAFGHPGAGGFLAFADTQAHLGFAYVKNAGPPERGGPDSRAGAIARALYRCLAN